MTTVICIATRNMNKVLEIAQILDLPPSLSLTDLSAHPRVPEISEDGTTYRENAIKKAETVAKLTGLFSIADDSGLSVDHLNGFPGLHSARYLGNLASDEDRCHDILHKLDGVPEKLRTARFICAAALAGLSMETMVFQESVEGIIAHKPAGHSGFGFDPIFRVPQLNKVMAELSPGQKNRISHRALAFRALRPHLLELIDK